MPSNSSLAFISLLLYLNVLRDLLLIRFSLFRDTTFEPLIKSLKVLFYLLKIVKILDFFFIFLIIHQKTCNNPISK